MQYQNHHKQNRFRNLDNHLVLILIFKFPINFVGDVFAYCLREPCANKDHHSNFEFVNNREYVM
jgi:hypothetical protein